MIALLLTAVLVGPHAPDPYQRIAQLEESSARSRRMMFYVSMNLACAGADLWSTSEAIQNGAIEANPLGQTVEKRVGLKLTQAAVSAILSWAVDRAWGAKAGWISAGTTAGIQCGAAISNLSQ